MTLVFPFKRPCRYALLCFANSQPVRSTKLRSLPVPDLLSILRELEGKFMKTCRDSCQEPEGVYRRETNEFSSSSSPPPPRLDRQGLLCGAGAGAPSVPRGLGGAGAGEGWAGRAFAAAAAAFSAPQTAPRCPARRTRSSWGRGGGGGAASRPPRPRRQVSSPAGRRHVHPSLRACFPPGTPNRPARGLCSGIPWNLPRALHLTDQSLQKGLAAVFGEE